MLEELLKKNKDAYYRMAWRYTRNREDALDVLQDSIEKAIRAQKKHQTIEHPNAWFYRILIRTAIDRVRRNKRIRPLDPVRDERRLRTEDRYADPDLERALGRLPDDCRDIVILRYFEDQKIDEVARIVELNPNTVKTRLRKALKLMRAELEEDIHDQT